MQCRRKKKNNNKEKYREEKNGSCARRGHHWSGATSNAIIFFYFHPFIPFFLTFYFSIFSPPSLAVRLLILSDGFVLKGFFFCFGCPSKPFPTSVICEKGKRFASLFGPNVSPWILLVHFLSVFIVSANPHCSSHTHTRIQPHMRRFSMYGIRMLCVYLLWILIMMYLFSI